MAKRVMKRAQFAEVHEWLTSWRGRHGGRRRPIPDELWVVAAEVAEVEGISTTARAGVGPHAACPAHADVEC